MILVIPSIELSNGICCDIIHGEVGTESLYDKFFRNPCELIKLWRRENAKSVHISDLDSFTMESAEVNINGIIYLTEMTDIPITLAHNFKDIELCNIFLTAGVYRIFISKLFFSNAYEYNNYARNTRLRGFVLLLKPMEYMRIIIIIHLEFFFLIYYRLLNLQE